MNQLSIPELFVNACAGAARANEDVTQCVDKERRQTMEESLRANDEDLKNSISSFHRRMNRIGANARIELRRTQKEAK